MLARTLGATAVTAALVLLPTVAQAAGPAAPAATVRTDDRVRGAVVAAQGGPASTGVPTDTLVVLGLVTLVGGAMLLVLTGRRPDDDEPAE